MKAALLALFACITGTSQQIEGVTHAIDDAIAKGLIPGAVCIAGHGDRILHRHAQGLRSYDQPGDRMRMDTVFDAASLTKVVATTSAIAKLWEQRRIDLDKPAATYLPEYKYPAITVRHLLTHFSGLRPDVDLEPPWSGYETGVALAIADVPQSKPGLKFVYSDINFVLLGEIVRRVSGVPLDEFVAQDVFAPLQMANTLFRPPDSMRHRAAPTERLKGELTGLQGVVHDPTTRYMGGVAGHAGMFTTADDLAKFARMMLSGGGALFRLETVGLFTSNQSPTGQTIRRGLGWDIDSPYSSPRGDLFPIGGYGHTGFTGTSMWMNPSSGTFVILLTNSVHPVPKGPVSLLRRAVANAVALQISTGQTLSGLDVLISEKFRSLQGKRVGLITNHTGLSRDGRRNIDAMLAAKVKLTALFSPEHGIAGKEDHENIDNTKDSVTGLPVYSLYEGQRRKPSDASLRGLDAMVFDIQDIGARFYTYLSTMVNAMEVAAQRKIPFYVLDRPNPIGGVLMEGPMLDADLQSFIGIRPLPVRHGMTLGELAKMINATMKPKAELVVVPMKNWRRSMWWDETGLPWVNPSPNMKSLPAALLYPGVAMLEFSKGYSVGRGTDAPFERISAPWIRGAELAAHLNSRFIPGLRFYPFADGVRILITDRDQVQASLLGIEIASALEKLYPGKIELDRCARLIGSHATIDAIKKGENPGVIARSWDLSAFLAQRRLYLLYD